MHLVLTDIVYFYRAESPEPHMKSDLGDIYSLFLHFFKKLLCEMESCCRSSCRAVKLRVNGVISVSVLELVLYVRWQRHLAEPVKHLFKNAVIVELDKPVTALYDIKNRSSQ